MTLLYHVLFFRILQHNSILWSQTFKFGQARWLTNGYTQKKTFFNKSFDLINVVTLFLLMSVCLFLASRSQICCHPCCTYTYNNCVQFLSRNMKGLKTSFCSFVAVWLCFQPPRNKKISIFVLQELSVQDRLGPTFQGIIVNH